VIFSDGERKISSRQLAFEVVSAKMLRVWVNMFSTIA